MGVVSDAGPIIHLSWIARLDLLDTLFGEGGLPAAVRDELLAPPPGTLGLERITAALEQGRLRVYTAAPQAAPDPPPPALAALDRGEREAIALAEMLRADLLLTDDNRARAIAQQRGLAMTGTLGTLRTAREQGHLTAILPLVEELRRRGPWFNAALPRRIREEERA